MTNEYIVSQMFFNNSQDNLLHNFTRHCSETDRPVITRVFLLNLLEKWDNNAVAFSEVDTHSSANV